MLKVRKNEHYLLVKTMKETDKKAHCYAVLVVSFFFLILLFFSLQSVFFFLSSLTRYLPFHSLFYPSLSLSISRSTIFLFINLIASMSSFLSSFLFSFSFPLSLIALSFSLHLLLSFLHISTPFFSFTLTPRLQTGHRYQLPNVYSVNDGVGRWIE